MPRHSPAAELQPDLELPEAHVERQAPAAHVTRIHVAPTHSSRLLIGAVAVSGGLHVAAAAAMLLAHTALPETGVLQTQTDAISLQTEQTIVLESMVSTPVEASAAAASALPEGMAEPTEATPAPLDPVEPRLVEEGPPPPTMKAAEVEPEVVETVEEPLQVVAGSGEPDAAIQAKPQREEKKQERQDERETKKKAEREKVERRRAKQQAVGGATSRAQASSAKSSGRVSASRGSVVSYAARVRAKVARSKPPGRGHRGVTRVSFGVSSSGGLSYARISGSSGNGALDRAALSAVRRAAPFGRPPAGASASQLRFSIPFYFR